MPTLFAFSLRDRLSPPFSNPSWLIFGGVFLGITMEIVVNSVRGKIHDCSSSLAWKIAKSCRYRAYNYQYTDNYLDGVWDGYVNKFSYKTNTFPSGLLSRIVKILEKEKIKFKITDKRYKLIWKNDLVLKNIDNFGHILRDYQIDGLITGLNNPYMIFWWATSSGKTVQFAAFCSALKEKEFRKTLILVTTKDLAAQHREEMEEMLGEKIGLIEEGRFEPKNITVAVINTLFNKAIRKKEKGVLNFLNSIEYLIVDECQHLIDSRTMKSVVNKCTNTIARHGFSGTPYSLTTDDMELECLTGPPLSKITMSDLILGGWVSRPEITMIYYDYPWLSGKAIYSVAYKNQIVNNKVRNKIIVDKAFKEYSINNKVVLVLIRMIKHGSMLFDMFKQRGLYVGDVEFIHGSSSKNHRKEVKERMKRKELGLVIASQIWNEGIDVPSIDVLVKADGGGGNSVTDAKGVRSVVQQVGRVVRKPVKVGELDVDNAVENTVKIYDFYDNVHKDLKKHSKNRLDTYMMESEFKVKEVRI